MVHDPTGDLLARARRQLGLPRDIGQFNEDGWIVVAGQTIADLIEQGEWTIEKRDELVRQARSTDRSGEADDD